MARKQVAVLDFINLFFGSAVKLAHSYAIIVPSTMGNAALTQIEFQSYVDYYTEKMCDIFGAADVKFGYGSWEGIKEDNAVITSFCEALTFEHTSDVQALAKGMQGALQQQCIAVIIDGAMYIYNKDS
jgi:hypothetical protein